MKIVRTLLFTVAFLFASFSQAQTFGIKTGILLNDIRQKLTTDIEYIINVQPEYSIGYTIGSMYRIPFNKLFSTQLELSYQKKGAKFDRLDNSSTSLHYLDLSAIASFQVIEDTHIDLGMGGSYLHNAGAWEKFDFGLVGGVSHFVSKKVKLSFRYYLGISPIQQYNFTNDTGQDAGSIVLYNRNATLSVGYYFL